MAVQLNTFAIPTPADLLADFLRTIRNGLIRRGVSNPNVGVDTDWYVLGSAVVSMVAPGFANLVVKADQQMPDTASGTDLERIAKMFGLSPRAAVGASGDATLPTTSVVPLVGAQCIDSAGKRFEVTARDVGAHSVTVQAVDGGADTNRAAGEILTWVAPTAGMAPTAVVAALGLIGGTNAEDTTAGGQSGLGARLFARLRFPPGGGNWPQVAQWAEEASGSVERAFVYPALNGPATLGVCVVAACTSYSETDGWLRRISDVELLKVSGAITAELPEHVNATAKTPAIADHVAAHVSLGLTLPDARAIGGAGGGWLDAVPWPVANASGVHLGRCQVTTATDATHIVVRVEGSERPTPYVTRVAWWDSANKAFVTSTVHAYSDVSAPLISLTLDPAAPLTGVAVGDMICPAAERLDTYGLALWESIAALGPGEWTSNVDALVYAARKPASSDAMPYALTATQLRAVSSTGDEVLDVSWLYRAATTPGVPSTTADSPKILAPARIAFYPIV